AVATFEAVQRTVERIRNLRSDIGLAPRAPLTLDVPANIPETVTSLLALLTVGQANAVAAVGANVDDALGAVEGRAPKSVMLERYRKDADRLRAEVERGEKKLANEAFTGKAAPEVVAKEREKLVGYRADL